MGKRKKYLTLTQNSDVPENIIKEYNRMTRHEKYLEEKDKLNISFQYGNEEELYDNIKMKATVSNDKELFRLSQKNEKIKKLLSYALNQLKEHHREYYDAVMLYYFSPEKPTMEQIGLKIGLSKQAVSYRIRMGHRYIRSYIAEKSSTSDKNDNI